MYAKSMRYLSAVAALGTLLLSGPGWAGPPVIIVGTWNGFSNQSAVTLHITSQGPKGQCTEISGTLGVDPIDGSYCFATGRVGFRRTPSGSKIAVQAYLGNVGTDAATDRMAGTFQVFSGVHGAGGALGEYPFYFTRP